MTDKKMTKIPDGAGGWKLVAADAVSPAGPHVADGAKRTATQQALFLKNATEHMERVIQIEQQFAKDMALGREERAVSMALLAINFRATYPGETGKPDPEAFDELAAWAQAQYDEEQARR